MSLIHESKGTLEQLVDAVDEVTTMMLDGKPKNLSAVHINVWPPKGRFTIEVYDTPLEKMHHHEGTLRSWAQTFTDFADHVANTDKFKQLGAIECAMSPSGSGRTQGWSVEEVEAAEAEDEDDPT